MMSFYNLVKKKKIKYDKTNYDANKSSLKLFFRVHAALFVSVIWHGFHAGYFFCIYFCPFYLMAEDIYYKLYYKEATGLVSFGLYM